MLPDLLTDLGGTEFVFGGPAQGYAQLALAYACRDIGARATYFVAKRNELHPFTAEAQSVGANIVEVPHGRLSVVQARARTYCEETGATFLPLGFDLPGFVSRLTDAARTFPLQPCDVWCVAGSGALSRALHAAWPDARHHAVRIGFEPHPAPEAEQFVAPEPFAKVAEEPPPFPSCANYDAKAWRFFSRFAKDGAVFWNVGA